MIKQLLLSILCLAASSSFAVGPISGGGPSTNLTSGSDFVPPPGNYYWIGNYCTGTQLTGGANATTCLQSALTAIETAMKANNGGRYVLDLGDAILSITGVLQDTGDANAQLLLPALDFNADQQCSLVIRGSADPSIQLSVIGSVLKPTKGARIVSTLATGGNILPSLLGCSVSGLTYNFSAVHLVLENVELETIANPLITALNASGVAAVELHNVLVDAGTYTVADATTPTHSDSYGIITPLVNNSAKTKLDNVHVLGFYNGLQLNEHTEGTFYAWGCLVGVVTKSNYHASQLTELGTYHVATGIKATGGTNRLRVLNWKIEHAASGAFAPVYDVDDASDYLKGDAEYAVVLAGVGIDSTFTKNSGANFHCYEFGSATEAAEFTDSFTRANSSSTLGASYSVYLGVWGISSNKAYAVSWSPTEDAFAVHDFGSGDGTVEVDITTPSSAAFSPGLVLRLSDADNNLLVQLSSGSGGELKFYKQIAGSYTTLATVGSQAYANSTTYHVKAVMTGTVVLIYVDGALKITYSTSTGLEANPKHGFSSYDGQANLFDNFSITP